MKKTILTLCALAFCLLPMGAQEGQEDYYPVGSTWEEYFNHVDREYRCVSTVVGDTVINDTIYRKVEVNSKNGDFSSGHFKHREYAIRQQGDSVFYYGPNYVYSSEGMYEKAASSERFVYNFDWTPGIYHEELGCTIHELPLMELEDGNLYEYYMDYNYRIIRTIGWVNGHQNSLFEVYNFGRTIIYPYVVSFTRNGQLLYYNPSLDESNGISPIAEDAGAPAYRGTYTLQGVRVEDPNRLPAGVYIVDGRKRVVR